MVSSQFSIDSGPNCFVLVLDFFINLFPFYSKLIAANEQSVTIEFGEKSAESVVISTPNPENISHIRVDESEALM